MTAETQLNDEAEAAWTTLQNEPDDLRNPWTRKTAFLAGFAAGAARLDALHAENQRLRAKCDDDWRAQLMSDDLHTVEGRALYAAAETNVKERFEPQQRQMWHDLEAERDAARAERDALRDAITALADEWLTKGITCECGHSIGGEHNGLGCYSRLSYDPLVTCPCVQTDDQFESDIAEAALRALLSEAGESNG